MKLTDEQISSLSQKVGTKLTELYWRETENIDYRLTDAIQMLSIEVVEAAIGFTLEYLCEIN